MGASHYDRKSIYEWNLDEYSEYEVMNLAQEMMMVVVAYKIENNNDNNIFDILTQGFTRSLKGWWENILTGQERFAIKHYQSSRVNNYGQEEKYSNNIIQLVYLIIKSFVAELVRVQERYIEQLMNLRCPILVDFRWYKDNFIPKVFKDKMEIQIFGKKDLL